MKLKPLGDRLIVKAVEEEETTTSGIVLPDTAKEKPQRGKVLAVGDGKFGDDNERVPIDVSEGDEVLYSKYGGTEITVDGEELLVLREELLAVDRDLGAAVLRVEDLVALGHVDRDALVVVAELAVADSEDLAALRLLLGRIGEDDAARGRLLLLYRLDDQTIAEGLELHEPNLRYSGLRCRWHSSKQSAKGVMQCRCWSGFG